MSALDLAVRARGLAAQNRARIGRLAALDRLEHRRRPALVHPSPPTVTYSATIPDGSYRHSPAWRSQARFIGAGTFVDSNSSIATTATGAFAGVELWHSGRYLAVGWRCQVAAKERVRIYVDGHPIAAAPETPSVPTVAGTFYYCYLDFGSDATRQVEFLVSSAAAITGVFAKATDGATWPTPPRRRLWCVGDSFWGGSGALPDTTVRPDGQIAQALDIDVGCSGLGGTGFVAAGAFSPFGSAARVAAAQAFEPHDILLCGSRNDDPSHAAVQAAAAAAIAAYRAACPEARIVVLGPPPDNAADTLAANRLANNAALHQACLGQPEVARFVDQIGTAGTAPVGAWTAGVTYQPGDKVTRLGSVWQLDTAAARADAVFPFGRYRLLSGIYGTGRVGAPAGDGNRDTMIQSDQIHPTETYCALIARRAIEAVYA